MMKERNRLSIRHPQIEINEEKNHRKCHKVSISGCQRRRLVLYETRTPKSQNDVVAEQQSIDIIIGERARMTKTSIEMQA